MRRPISSRIQTADFTTAFGKSRSITTRPEKRFLVCVCCCSSRIKQFSCSLEHKQKINAAAFKFVIFPRKVFFFSFPKKAFFGALRTKQNTRGNIKSTLNHRATALNSFQIEVYIFGSNFCSHSSSFRCHSCAPLV